MLLRKLFLATSVLVLLQTSCADESPTGPSPAATNIPVRLGGTSSATEPCAPLFEAVRAEGRRGAAVTWTLQSGCDRGAATRVSLVDWTFTDRDGRQVKGKHPFTSDCRLDATLENGGARITCTIAADAPTGPHQYYVCMETGGQTVCRDPIIYIED